MRKPPTDPSPESRGDDATPDPGRVDGQSSGTNKDEIEFAEASAEVQDVVTEQELELIELTDADFVEAELVDEAATDAATAPDANGPSKALPPPLPPPPPPEPPKPPRQLVLIGAGHTHLQILKWWRAKPFQRTELTMVTAFGQAAFSSMLPATLAGLYRPEEMLIDIPRLCEYCGVRLIVDRANRLDPVEKTIEFAHQPALKFDVASINIGSVPAAEPLWQSHRILISVKPLSTFLKRFDVRFRELVEQWKMAPGDEMLQIVVVGGGAAGVELALCLEQHKHELELPADVRIVDGNPSVLSGFSPRTIRRVDKLLKLRGIDLSLGSPVADCDDEGPGTLILENGERIRADLVIWAAGAAPPMALRGFDLPKTDRGFLATRRTLQSTADVPVFVSGDAADLESGPIPKSSVYAVRQAPILWRNLRNCLSESPLIEYRPQSSCMRLLACGDGTAILDYKGFTSHSSLAWMLKNWMDRRWVRQFQV